MRTYRIKYAEENHQYGKALTFKTTTVEADSFKVNDQGTVVFVDRSGSAIASFKTWVTIKPVGDPKPSESLMQEGEGIQW